MPPSLLGMASVSGASFRRSSRRRSPFLIGSEDDYATRSLPELLSAGGADPARHVADVAANPRATQSERIWAREMRTRGVGRTAPTADALVAGGLASLGVSDRDARTQGIAKASAAAAASRRAAADADVARTAGGFVSWFDKVGIPGQPGGAYGFSQEALAASDAARRANGVLPPSRALEGIDAANRYLNAQLLGLPPSETPPSWIQAGIEKGGRALGVPGVGALEVRDDSSPFLKVAAGLERGVLPFANPEMLMLGAALRPLHAAGAAVSARGGLAAKIAGGTLQRAPELGFTAQAGAGAVESLRAGADPWGVAGEFAAMALPVAYGEYARARPALSDKIDRWKAAALKRDLARSTVPVDKIEAGVDYIDATTNARMRAVPSASGKRTRLHYVNPDGTQGPRVGEQKLAAASKTLVRAEVHAPEVNAESVAAAGNTDLAPHVRNRVGEVVRRAVPGASVEDRPDGGWTITTKHGRTAVVRVTDTFTPHDAEAAKAGHTAEVRTGEEAGLYMPNSGGHLGVNDLIEISGTLAPYTLGDRAQVGVAGGARTLDRVVFHEAFHFAMDQAVSLKQQLAVKQAFARRLSEEFGGPVDYKSLSAEQQAAIDAPLNELMADHYSNSAWRASPTTWSGKVRNWFSSMADALAGALGNENARAYQVFGRVAAGRVPKGRVAGEFKPNASRAAVLDPAFEAKLKAEAERAKSSGGGSYGGKFLWDDGTISSKLDDWHGNVAARAGGVNFQHRTAAQDARNTASFMKDAGAVRMHERADGVYYEISGTVSPAQLRSMELAAAGKTEFMAEVSGEDGKSSLGFFDNVDKLRAYLSAHGMIDVSPRTPRAAVLDPAFEAKLKAEAERATGSSPNFASKFLWDDGTVSDGMGVNHATVAERASGGETGPDILQRSLQKSGAIRVDETSRSVNYEISTTVSPRQMREMELAAAGKDYFTAEVAKLGDWRRVGPFTDVDKLRAYLSAHDMIDVAPSTPRAAVLDPTLEARLREQEGVTPLDELLSGSARHAKGRGDVSAGYFIYDNGDVSGPVANHSMSMMRARGGDLPDGMAKSGALRVQITNHRDLLAAEVGGTLSASQMKTLGLLAASRGNTVIALGAGVGPPGAPRHFTDYDAFRKFAPANGLVDVAPPAARAAVRPAFDRPVVTPERARELPKKPHYKPRRGMVDAWWDAKDEYAATKEYNQRERARYLSESRMADSWDKYMAEPESPSVMFKAHTNTRGERTYIDAVGAAADKADASLSGSASDAVDSWVGIKHGSDSEGGIMSEYALEDAFSSSGKSDAARSARSQIESAWEPVRNMIRDRWGDSLHLYRFQSDVPDGGWGSHRSPRQLFSWTLNPEVARRMAQPGGGRVVEADIKVDDIVWATDRAGQAEFIVKSPSPPTARAAVRPGGFMKADVEPAVDRGVERVAATWDNLLSLSYPRARVPRAGMDALTKRLGNIAAAHHEAVEALRPVTEIMKKLSHAELVAFDDVMKTPRARHATPELQRAADILRAVDDASLYALRAEGVDVNYKEGHLRVDWEVIPAGEAREGDTVTLTSGETGVVTAGHGMVAMPIQTKSGAVVSGHVARIDVIAKKNRLDPNGMGGNAPLRGTRGNLKQSTVPTVSEGMRMGGVARTVDPVKMVVDNAIDSMRHVASIRMLKDLHAQGLLQYDRSGSKPPPEGFVKVKDAMFDTYRAVMEGVYNKTPVNQPLVFKDTGRSVVVKTGTWYVEANTARLLNNTIAPDIWRTTAPLDILMPLRNYYAALELIGPMFHAVTVTGEALMSSAGTGLRRVANLRDMGGVLPAVTGGMIQKGGSAFYKTTAEGKALQKYVGQKAREKFGAATREELKAIADYDAAWASANPGRPLPMEFIKDFLDAGGQLHMSEEYRTVGMNAARAAWRERNKTGSIIRAIGATPQAVSSWLFEDIIPAMKLGVYSEELGVRMRERAADIAANPAIEAEIRRGVVDFIDDRFGEVNWNALFMNPNVKTMMQLIMRSPSWRGGSLRAFVRAPVEQTQELIRASNQSRRVRVEPGAAWLAGMAWSTVMVGTLLSKVRSGKFPWEWDDAKDPRGMVKNFIFPHSDGADARSRMAIPGYQKLIYEMFTDTRGFLSGGKSGFLSKYQEVAQNKTFYGDKIVQPGTKPGMAMLQSLAHIAVPTPFVYSGIKKSVESGEGAAGVVSGAFGFQRASAKLSMTPLEEHLSGILQERFEGLPGKTAEQSAAGKVTRAITMAYRKADQDAIETSLQAAMDARERGEVTDDQIRSAMSASARTPLQASFRKLAEPEDMVKAFRLASKAEREEIHNDAFEKVMTWIMTHSGSPRIPAIVAAANKVGLEVQE